MLASSHKALGQGQGHTLIDEDPFPASQRDYDALRYEFEITLRDEDNWIHVFEQGNVTWVEPSATTFVLDLSNEMVVSSVTLDGLSLDFLHDNGRIVAALPEDCCGSTSHFTVEYTGVPTDGLVIGDTKHGRRCFFGDNWPNRARNWLATNDHPSDKASVSFTVNAPSKYDVIATGVLRSQFTYEDGTKTTHYSSNIDHATKVMVIGVAEFAIEEYQGFTVPTASWIYPEDAEKYGFGDYAPGGSIMAFLEQTFGEFPYEKIAHVQSRTRFGGMENAGNIFYNEDSVSGSPPFSLIAHELGHQWFGNSASECEWNHLWLSEGFAVLSANYTFLCGTARVSLLSCLLIRI